MSHLIFFSSFNELGTLTTWVQSFFSVLISCFYSIKLFKSIAMFSYFMFLQLSCRYCNMADITFD